MKRQNILLLIYLLIILFAFSACQKSATENEQMQLSGIPTRNEKLSIKEIDFRNYAYSDNTGKNTFTLKNGEEPFGQMKDIAFKLETIEYADLTSDAKEEAVIHISIQYGGSAKSGLLYVFTLENQKPKMLWYAESGYGAEGELKNAYVENNKLIVELFGNIQFIEGIDKFKFPNHKNTSKNLCCPTKFTRFQFKWNGEKFIAQGKPELFDYDWKTSETKANE